MAALVRAFGIDEERSPAVQAKLRLVVPALVSFVSSCLGECGDAPTKVAPTSACAQQGRDSSPGELLSVSAPVSPAPKSMSFARTRTVESPAPSDPGLVRPLTGTGDRKLRIQRTLSETGNPTSPRRGSLSLDASDMLTQADRLALVKQAPCFNGLDKEALHRVADSFEVRRYCDGEEITFPGDPEWGMHIIVQGRVKVSVMREVSLLGPGGTFGEKSLMSGICARECLEPVDGDEVVTMRISPAVFESLNLKQKLMVAKSKEKHVIRQRSENVERYMTGSFASDEGQEGHTEEDTKVIVEAVMTNSTMMELLKLTDDQINYMATLAKPVTYAKGDLVFAQGDIGDAFYIVHDGIFSPFVQRGTLSGPESTTTEVKKLCFGDSFGELALLYDALRSMSVKCVQDGKLWMVTKAAFKSVISMRYTLRIRRYRELIAGVPLFQKIDEGTKADLVNALEEMHFHYGQDICVQGDVGHTFYVLIEGTCRVTVDGQETNNLKPGDHFGEKALLEDEPRSATVQVSSETCIVLAVDRITFTMILQHVRKVDVMTRQPTVRGIPRSRLERVGVLGQGTFGFVTLERDSATNRLFALKALSKGQIVKERLESAVKNEIECMKILGANRFIIQLYDTYLDKQCVYLLLEPCFGGELLDVYGDNSLWGSERHARFYVASVTLGFVHMHERKIIYRDLKMENCLLDSLGNLKLADMGIAKVCFGKTYTVCGTADYFAPETLRQTGHNRAADWWALGVLAFVMLTGRTPFEAETDVEIYKKIVKGFAKVVKFPSSVKESAKNMILQLCQKDPEERLTMLAGGDLNLRKHAWFTGFDWEGLRDATLDPPFVPPRTDEQTASVIAAKPPVEAPQFPYKGDGDKIIDWEDIAQTEEE
eukprot:TRINITY_DN15331_c0_g2_i2.p1 TRINITY_DN15331_c0_g2~~TRINITY_DN15331_c0_g2_i2.p1  ORF type:complete len:941 (+),score=222.70 TRINITY_DN15331_c0_g2_i2:180-2825(+)